MRPRAAVPLANRAICAVAFVLAVSGCASMRSYDQELQATVASAASGNLDNAIKTLDAANPGTKVVLAHLGGGLPFYTHLPEVRRALQGVAFDTAASGYLYEASAYGVIASMLVGVKATDPLTFAGMALLFFVIAAVACWLPARRAAGLAPTQALREE